ncbi:MAG TPA: hypothetical protein VMH02_11675, partial [Verrucomicrobiae bacterium]|nr:hypothetical protein [Verrucomicrobiae bacterium]
EGSTPVLYHNPISVTLSENSGSASYSGLILNGGSPQKSVTLRYSTDTVVLQYNGGGGPGYSATVTLTASGATGPAVITFSPLFASTNGSTAITSLALNGSLTSPTVTVGEAGAPSSTRYYVTNGCGSSATTSAVSGSGSSATFSVAGTLTANASCPIVVADGTTAAATMLTLTTSNTLVQGQITVDGTQITQVSLGAATTYVTEGPDGNMYLTDTTNESLDQFNPSSGYVTNSFSVPFSDLYGAAPGSDGAMWVADQDLEGIDRITTYGSLAQYSTQLGGSPIGVATGNDGTIWVADQVGSLWNVTMGGAITQTSLTLHGSPGNAIVGPDGNVWFAEGGYIGQASATDPPTVLNQYAVPAGDTAVNLASDPADNEVWYTAEGSTPVVGYIPTGGGSPGTFDIAATATPTGIAVGVDKGVWYLDSTNDQLGRISTVGSNVMSLYPLPSGSNPTGIATGPDGRLYVTEPGASSIAVVQP